MAKGIGLIGNFRGKVGNMVGYNLKDSNNKQTQGVRVYQPIVKNPKTYGQAEQRAKLAPINATYRALKMIIDRGQEGKAYGNKSRLAWLSAAMKAFNGGWFEKGAAITAPALVPLTKGSLASIYHPASSETTLQLNVGGISEETSTLGALSTAILASFPLLQNGDQITFINQEYNNGNLRTFIESIVLDTTSTDAVPSFLSLEINLLSFDPNETHSCAAAVVISREGTNGEHLRSSSMLYELDGYDENCLTDAAKEAAIKSYMAAGSNVDWAEESLQG